jgi:hypothetical protein
MNATDVRATEILGESWQYALRMPSDKHIGVRVKLLQLGASVGNLRAAENNPSTEAPATEYGQQVVQAMLVPDVDPDRHVYAVILLALSLIQNVVGRPGD